MYLRIYNVQETLLYSKAIVLWRERSFSSYLTGVQFVLRLPIVSFSEATMCWHLAGLLLHLMDPLPVELRAP